MDSLTEEERDALVDEMLVLRELMSDPLDVSLMVHRALFDARQMRSWGEDNELVRWVEALRQWTVAEAALRNAAMALEIARV